MPFYIRKSVSVGPFRFNFSKSGIGISTGIKGLRVGMGPRGNYVHMGRGGVYYRTTLSSSNKRIKQPVQIQTEFMDAHQKMGNYDTHEPLEDIESGSVLAMTDSSSSELIEEINEKRRRMKFSVIFVWVSVAGLSLAFAMGASTPILISLIVFGGGLIGLGSVWDQIKKSTVLFYDFDSAQEQAYRDVHNGYDRLSSTNMAWHIQAEGAVKDKKYHAGADKLVRKKPIRFVSGDVPCIKTNISVPSIPVGRQVLYFFPDRVLVFDSSEVGAISYGALRIDQSASKFIEDGRVPSDCEVVGYTWKYVNKKGGPDKRFKDNHQIPVVVYEQIHFSSDTGLNELIETSRVGAASDFVRYLKLLGETCG